MYHFAIWLNAALALYAAILAVALLVILRVEASAAHVQRTVDWLACVVSFLLVVHCVRGLNAVPAIFSRWHDRRSPIVYWTLLTVLAACSIFPSVACVTSPLLFVTYGIGFTVATLYSIENMLFQNLLFHLAIGNGLRVLPCAPDFIARLQTTTLVSCVLHFAILMHSGAVEKLRDPTWRNGEAAEAFLSQRHLISNWFAEFVPRIDSRLLKTSSWLLLAAEGVMLPACLHSSSAVIAVVVLALFAISLFTIADLSFIGQLVLVHLGIVAVGIWSGVTIDWHPSPADLALPAFSAFAFCLTLTSLAVHEGPWRESLRLGWTQHCLSGINCPLRVFTEVHLRHAWVYRFWVEPGFLPDSSQTFTESGGPAGLQRLRPRYLQSAMYAVGRAFCAEQSGEPLSLMQRSLIEALLTTARRLAGVPPDAPAAMYVSPACQLRGDTTHWIRFRIATTPVCSGSSYEE